MMKFLHERIWVHTPATVSNKTRIWAGLIWGMFFIGYGILMSMAQRRHGLPTTNMPLVLIAIGVVLGMSMVLIRPLGERIYLFVLRLFAIPGFFIGLLFLLIGFYLVVTPMGLIMRLAGKDLLRTTPRTGPQWIEHPGPPDRKRFYRLF